MVAAAQRETFVGAGAAPALAGGFVSPIARDRRPPAGQRRIPAAMDRLSIDRLSPPAPGSLAGGNAGQTGA